MIFVPNRKAPALDKVDCFIRPAPLAYSGRSVFLGLGVVADRQRVVRGNFGNHRGKMRNETLELYIYGLTSITRHLNLLDVLCGANCGGRGRCGGIVLIPSNACEWAFVKTSLSGEWGYLESLGYEA